MIPIRKPLPSSQQIRDSPKVTYGLLGNKYVHHWKSGEVTEEDKSAGYTVAGWYFTDETGTDVIGPFDDEPTATRAFQAYLI